MNFLNHETQLALCLADPNNSEALLLKLTFITLLKLSLDLPVFLTKELGLNPISCFHIFSNCQLARARWVKISSCKICQLGRRTPYAVGRRRTRLRAIPLALTKILASMGYHFLLPMVLCWRALRARSSVKINLFNNSARLKTSLMLSI